MEPIKSTSEPKGEASQKDNAIAPDKGNGKKEQAFVIDKCREERDCRLCGNIYYWIGAVLAVVAFIGGGIVANNNYDMSYWLLGIMAAALLWSVFFAVATMFRAMAKIIASLDRMAPAREDNGLRAAEQKQCEDEVSPPASQSRIPW